MITTANLSILNGILAEVPQRIHGHPVGGSLPCVNLDPSICCTSITVSAVEVNAVPSAEESKEFYPQQTYL